MMATRPRATITTTTALVGDHADDIRAALEDQFDTDMVPLDAVIIDYSYARPLTQARIRKLDRMSYNSQKAGVLYMSLRNNGQYAVIDGQGRIYLATQAGVKHVPARIYIDLTREQEAQLYLAFNRDRAATTALDNYLAELEAGDQSALAVQDLLNSLGIRVMRGGDADNVIQSIGMVMKVYRDWGPHVLKAAMTLLLDVWGGRRGGLTGELIGGATAFIIRYPHLKPQQRTELVNRLKAYDPNRLKGRARSKQEESHMMALDQAIGRVMLSIYNHGRRSDSPNILGPWQDRVLTPSTLAKKPAAGAKAGVTRRANRAAAAKE